LPDRALRFVSRITAHGAMGEDLTASTSQLPFANQTDIGLGALERCLVVHIRSSHHVTT